MAVFEAELGGGSMRCFVEAGLVDSDLRPGI
jgi:hypothetical protein